MEQKQILNDNNICKSAFKRIVEINKNNGWINPVYKPYKSKKYRNEFFCVIVDDFLEVESNYEIQVFSISKRWGEIIFYCQVKLFEENTSTETK